MFRNFFVELTGRGEFDGLDNGENSCAFYVSSVLTIFKKLKGVHGTVDQTIGDLEESGWVIVDKPEPGDVIIWEQKQFSDGLKRHIGFYLGKNQAVSTLASKKAVAIHDLYFGNDNRKIEVIYRCANWDD